MNIFTLIFRAVAGIQGINLCFEDLKICAGRIKGTFLTFINISSYVCCPNNPLPYESKENMYYLLVSYEHQAVSIPQTDLFWTFSQFSPGGQND
jgi:hypothetical protein